MVVPICTRFATLRRSVDAEASRTESLRLQIRQDVAQRHEALAATLVDLEHFEQPAAQLALKLLDGTRRGARQRDHAAGTAVVSAGPAQPDDHRAQQFAGLGPVQ